MNDDERRALRILNGAGALTASACLLGLLGAGFGHVPALGRQLVPGHGAWTVRQHAVNRSAVHPSAGSHGSGGSHSAAAHRGPSASGSPGVRP